MTYAQIIEQRNKLMNDAAKLAQTKDVTKEQKEQVRTMLADVDILEADAAIAKRLEDFAAEQRNATAPPRGKPGEIAGDIEQERRAMRNFLVNGERRDLGTVTSGAMTGGSQLIARCVLFHPESGSARIRRYRQHREPADD